jgi:hypothetical protein
VPHAVPAGSALIFVAGVAGEGSQAQIRVLEVLLQAPTYPYALTASQAIVTYCSCVGCGWVTWPGAANLIDGETTCETGSVLVRPMPSGMPWRGGYVGGGTPGPGVCPPYAVFMPRGSVVTGKIVTAGKTDFHTVCCPCPCNMFQHACTPPETRHIVHVCPSASPSSGESIPDLRAMLSPTVAVYTDPSTYPSTAPSTVPWNTVCMCTPCGTGSPICVRVYSNGGLVLPPCRISGSCHHPIQINGDTLLVAPSPTGRNEPILLLGRHDRPIEFTGEYTLTVQNAFLNIPGGIVGSASNFVNATLLILPLPLNGCKAPNLNEYSEVRVRHHFHGCNGQCGFGAACASNVSVFSVGNLVIGDPCRGTCTSCHCKACERWEMDGLFATLGGTLTFYYTHVRVKGMLFAEDPWATVQCCGGRTAGNMGVIFMHGEHVSYSPTMARQASIGQSVAPASTQDGLTVVYWRDIQPGL